MRVIAVVPAYNEASVIGAVIHGLRRFVGEVMVVDDGSTDVTATVARQAGAVVVRHFLNRGQGAALATGMAAAVAWGADIVVTFDADGQHDPADIPKLVEPLLLERHDVCLGSRFLGNRKSAVPAARRALLQFAVFFDRLRTGLRITDTHNGLRAFTAAAAAQLRIRQDGMAHASEILDHIASLGLRYVEVPVTVRYTHYARAKGQRLSGGFTIVRDLLVRRWLP